MKDLIHVEVIGADSKTIYIICDCDYKNLREYLDLKGFTDYKIIDWKLKPTLILK